MFEWDEKEQKEKDQKFESFDEIAKWSIEDVEHGYIDEEIKKIELDIDEDEDQVKEKEKNQEILNIGKIEGAEIRLSEIRKKKKVEKVIRSIDELRISGMQEWGKENGNTIKDINFSMFGSVKSEHSDKNSVVQEKKEQVKNPSINFDDFMNKSSAVVRESIVSASSQQPAKPQINFSMFGSVKSEHSDKHSVKEEKRESINSNKQNPKEEVNFSMFGSVKSEHSDKNSVVQEKKEQVKNPSINFDDFMNKSSAVVRESIVSASSQQPAKPQINFSMFGSVKSEHSDKHSVKEEKRESINSNKQNPKEEVNFSMFGSVKSEHSDKNSVVQEKKEQVKNPSINFDDFMNKSSAVVRESIVSASSQQPAKPQINFSMFGSVKSEHSDKHSVKEEKRESINSNKQNPKEEVNFSMFGSVKSEHSDKNSVVQEKKEQVKNPSINFDDFMNKSSAVVRESIVSASSQQPAKPQINFSMFGSVKSEHSDKHSVKEEKRESINSNKQNPKEEVNFSMFGSVKSEHSDKNSVVQEKKEQVKNPSINFDDFMNKSSAVVRESIVSASSQQPAKPQINFSMFGSVKSEHSDKHSVKEEKRESINSNKQNPKEEVNFSMFGSVKSEHSDKNSVVQEKKEQVKNPSINFDDFMNKSSAVVRESIVSASSQQPAKPQINFSMFGSVKSEHSDKHSVKEEKRESINSNKQNPKEEVNFSMFGSVKSEHSDKNSVVQEKKEQVKNPSINFDDFMNKSSAVVRESIVSASSQQPAKPQINFSMFGSVKSEHSDKHSVKEEKRESINSNKQNPKEEVNFSMFGSVKSEHSDKNSVVQEKKEQVKNPSINFDDFMNKSSAVVRESIVSASSQQPAKPQINFSMFGSVKSEHSDKHSVKEEKRESINSNKQNPKEEVNFSMFGSVKSEHSDKNSVVQEKKEQVKNPSINFDDFMNKSSAVVRESIVSASSQQPAKPQINFSMFGNVKSEHSDKHSVKEEKRESINSNKQNPKEEVNFSMFGSVKSEHSDKNSVVQEKKEQVKNPSINFDDFMNKSSAVVRESIVSASSQQPAKPQINFSMFGSVKSEHSDKHSVKEEKRESINSNKQNPKEEVNFSMFGSVKSEHSDKNSVVQEKKEQVKNPSINFDDFMNKSSAVVRESIVSASSQQPAKPQINFSMFGSVKSEHSDKHSVKEEKRESINSNKQNPKEEVNFSMFGSVKSEHSDKNSVVQEKKEQVKNPSINFDDFMNKSSAVVRESIVSASSQQPAKPQINFSMFGSVKSEHSDKHSVKEEKRESINSNKQNPKEEVNFRMFQSFDQHNQSHSTSFHQPFFPFLTSNAPPSSNIVNPFNNPFQNHSPQAKPINNEQLDQSNSFHHPLSNASSTQFFHRQQINIIKQIQADEHANTLPKPLIKQQVYRAAEKFNKIFKTLQSQSNSINNIKSQYQNYLLSENQSINQLLKELQTIKKDILNLSMNHESDDSSNTSYFNENQIKSIISDLQKQNQAKNSQFIYLFDKIKKLEELIMIFTNQINKKTQTIKSDPFYKVSSPLDLNQCFRKKQESRVNQINILKGKSVQNSSSQDQFGSFYISQKFKESQSYKKLFAPKENIQHKSSFVDINFDYSFQETKSRKVLRIMITVKNTSNFNLREFSALPVKQNEKILAIKPQKIFIPEFKSGQAIHQIIYVSQFNKDCYFIPFNIKFITESNTKKDVSIPISLDITKFLEKTKVNHDKVIDNYPYKCSFHLANKSQLTFYFVSNSKILKLISNNQSCYLDIFETMLDNGTYMMQVLSNDEIYAQKMEEYLKFMYSK